MAHRSATRHDVNASNEFDPSALSCWKLVEMVIDLRLRLDEHQAKAGREREQVAIHRDTAEHKRKAVI